MSWRIFERAADRYEQWYGSGRGLRADAAERKLVVHLLKLFPDAQRALEIGCGTGHFAAFLGGLGLKVTGLDRAPAMLAQARKLAPCLPVVLGDAHFLPFHDRSTDLAIFITTLEFLENPGRAMQEAVRVARQGVAAVVLNRFSVGGWSRRWGPQSRGALLSTARDFSARELGAYLEQATAARAETIEIVSTLFPDGWSATISHIPFGDVVGGAVKLKPDP
jgi:ubiquinone/menaquinone biosynthesis C-methylase UbiE